MVENGRIRSGNKPEHVRMGGRRFSSEVKDRMAALIKKFDSDFAQRTED